MPHGQAAARKEPRALAFLLKLRHLGRGQQHRQPPQGQQVPGREGRNVGKRERGRAFVAGRGAGGAGRQQRASCVISESTPTTSTPLLPVTATLAAPDGATEGGCAEGAGSSAGWFSA